MSAVCQSNIFGAVLNRQSRSPIWTARDSSLPVWDVWDGHVLVVNQHVLLRVGRPVWCVLSGEPAVFGKISGRALGSSREHVIRSLFSRRVWTEDHVFRAASQNNTPQPPTMSKRRSPDTPSSTQPSRYLDSSESFQVLDFGSNPPPPFGAENAFQELLVDQGLDDEVMLTIGLPPTSTTSAQSLTTDTSANTSSAIPFPVQETSGFLAAREHGQVHFEDDREKSGPFKSETVITALLIWDRLLRQFGSFPWEVLELIFNFTIGIFHAHEHMCYTASSYMPVVAINLDNENFMDYAYSFETNPLNLWTDSNPLARKVDTHNKASSARYASHPVSFCPFPVFITNVFDNIKMLDKMYCQHQVHWRTWFKVVGDRVKQMSIDFPVENNKKINKLYISTTQMNFEYTYNKNGYVQFVLRCPQVKFSLIRSNCDYEMYCFNKFGDVDRLTITAFYEAPDETQVPCRLIAGFRTGVPILNMDQIRRICRPKPPSADFEIESEAYTINKEGPELFVPKEIVKPNIPERIRFYHTQRFHSDNVKVLSVSNFVKGE